MAIKQVEFKIEGFAPLLLNNPQSADPLNKYSKLRKPITSKRIKTDEDHAELADLDIRSKIYWDDDLKLCVPSSWVQASINKVSNSVSRVSKAAMRGGLFMTDHYLKLHYKDMDKVVTPEDIIKNSFFRKKLLLPQKTGASTVRIAKSFPILHEWYIKSTLEFDDSVTNSRDLNIMLEKAAQYGGYGDFRPTFGRALVTEWNES